MGCWNETCGISRLPIFAGDLCVAVVQKDPDKYGLSSLSFYTSAVHSQIFKGVEYNDYGAWDGCLEEYKRDPYQMTLFHFQVWEDTLKFWNADLLGWYLEFMEKELQKLPTVLGEKRGEFREIMYCVPAGFVYDPTYEELCKIQMILGMTRRNMNVQEWKGSQESNLKLHISLLQMSLDKAQESLIKMESDE